MTNKLNQKKQIKGFELDLPRKQYSALSHLANIEHCIRQIRRYSGEIKNPVIGYVLERGFGNREAHHQIVSQENAEALRGEFPRFDYMTLDDFLKEKEAIEKGKYIMSKGLIVDLSPSYY